MNRVNGDGWRGSQQERGGLCLCLCLCITGCRLPLLLAAGQVYRRRHASGARCPPPLHTARRRQHYWGARQRWRRRLRPPGVPGLKEVIDGSLSLSLLFSSLSFPFFLWWKGRTMLRVFFTLELEFFWRFVNAAATFYRLDSVQWTPTLEWQQSLRWGMESENHLLSGKLSSIGH